MVTRIPAPRKAAPGHSTSPLRILRDQGPEVARKAAQALPEMAHFFGDYSAAIKKRQEMMHGHLRRVEAELDKLTQQLRERFSEMKKFELALANWQKRKDDAAARKLGQEMDEIGIRGYVRRDVS